MLSMAAFRLGYGCCLYKIMDRFAFIVEGACSAVVDKIQPAFRGVQEVQVHVARHRILFMPCADGLIIKFMGNGQIDNGLYFDYRHEYEQCATSFKHAVAF
ncbi:hypothetical protein IMSAGC006_00343 [Muribaculaceae bacterium]|nr:hypothetical protein IMSAGC006_00343 [Muribaculaceae bacterium]